MATLRKQIALDAPAATVWLALRDFGAVHRRVAPGFLTDLRMDNGDRIVTFFNGLVARERLVPSTTRPAGWSIRSLKVGPAITMPRFRSSQKAKAAVAWSGRSISCRTSSRQRSAA